MKTRIAILTLAILMLIPAFASCGSEAATAVVLEPFDGKTDSFRKYSFSEETARLIPGEYCAPVCLSSQLMWLNDNGLPGLTDRTGDTEKDQFNLAMKLGEPEYMDSLGGTTVNVLCDGLRSYILARGFRYRTLEYRGWQYAGAQYNKAFLPDLDIARAALRNKYGFAILTVGYYSHDGMTDEYYRQGGHVVPMIGDGYDGKTNAPGYITTFNPYPMPGMPAINYFNPIEISGGLLYSPLTLAPCTAEGFYELPGMHVPEGSDTSIIDGIIVLEMWP
jgi:hypothetical protein